MVISDSDSSSDSGEDADEGNVDSPMSLINVNVRPDVLAITPVEPVLRTYRRDQLPILCEIPVFKEFFARTSHLKNLFLRYVTKKD